MKLLARGISKKEKEEIKQVTDLQQDPTYTEINKLITNSSKLRKEFICRNTTPGEIICFQVKAKDSVYWIDESGKDIEKYISSDHTKVFPNEFCISVLVPSNKEIETKYIAKEFIKQENAILRKIIKKVSKYKKGIVTFRYKPVQGMHKTEEGVLFVEQLSVTVWKA